MNSHPGKSLETETAVSARAFVDKVEKYVEEKNKVDPCFRNGSLTKAFFRSLPKKMQDCKVDSTPQQQWRSMGMRGVVT